MLEQVDALDLVLGLDREADRAVEGEADDRGDDERVDQDRCRTLGLGAELAEPAAEEQTVVLGETGGRGGAVRGVREEADEQRADESAHEVDADDVEAVVEAQLELQAHGQCTARPGDDTDDQGAGAETVAQAGVMATRPATTPEAAPRDVGWPSRNFSTMSQPSMAVQVAPRVLTQTPAAGARPERRPRVEAEPAEPQDAGADHDEGEVVGPHGLLAPAHAVADEDCQRESRDTGVDVDGGTTGEVVGADAAEEETLGLVGDPAAGLGRVPTEGEHPVGHGEVDEGRPDEGEGRPGAELDAVGDRAGDQGHRDDREDDLEGDEGGGGDPAGGRGAGVGVRRDVPDDLREDPAQPELVEGVTDEPHTADVGAECLAVPPQDPGGADGPHRDERHHHHVEDALGADHAAVEEGQAGRHEEDEGRGREYPSCVPAVDERPVGRHD